MQKLDRSYLDELRTGVLLLDRFLKIKYLNPSAQSLLDTSFKSSKNKKLKELFFEESEDFDSFLENLNNKTTFSKVDILLFIKGGKKLLCDYHIQSFKDDLIGEGFILEIIDKDYSHEVRERIRSQTNQEVTSAFIKGLAHEIKNPLSGIRGAAQLLSQKLPKEHLGEYTEIIINQTDRLSSLVDDILGPNRKPTFELQNIHAPLESVITLLKQNLSENGINLLKDYDPSIPEIYLDIYLLEQSILNLVNNAKESLIEGEVLSPEIKIITRVLHQELVGETQHKTVCKISVIDNGPGIPKDLKDSVFFPMISSKPEGSGLGLSITQGIISQHNGIIKFESEPGKTEFSILIPIDHELSEQELRIVNA
jgi:two-component system nitrogen regulation sensor histidine kinase GlnL